MQLVYNGPHPEVVVDELDSEKVITAGQPVEIPDDLAARLLEQSTWSQSSAKASSSSSPSTPVTQTPTASSGSASDSSDSSTKGN